MRKFLRILKYTGFTLITIIAVFAIVVIMRQNLKFDAPYPELHSSSDSAVIAQGKYLFYGPAHCMDCHSNRVDYPNIGDLENIPPSGGFEFHLPVGTIRTANITSDKETGIGNLTDAEIARTLRYGVGSDGRAIFDFMPFHNTSDEDLTAIISYLRTIPPVKRKVKHEELNVVGKIVKAFLITPVGPSEEVPKKIDRGVTVEYGKYLANSVANCRGCHTQRDMMTGAFIGKDFAGGLKMDIDGKPGMFLVTRNLTPDKETGHIYNWSEEKFVERFRQGKLIPDSPMPWEPFAKMSDDDLKAIYKYLNSLEPVRSDPGPVIITENIN